MALTIFYTLISVLIVSLVSLVGIFSLLFRYKNLDKILLFLVGLSAGTLFSGAFLHLLPEAVAKKGFTLSVSLLVLGGIMVFFLLEKAIHWHHHHSLPSQGDVYTHVSHHPYHLAPLNLIGDGMHNFIDGLIIAGSYLASLPLGIAVTIGVVLHEVPQEMADFGVLLYAGWSKSKALLLNFLSATLAIIGAVVGLVIGSSSENFVQLLLPFAAGGFLYIAGSNLIPELHKENGLKSSLWHILALLLGVVLIYGLRFLE